MKLSNLLPTFALAMAKQLDRGDLAALARMPPKQVQREARSFLASLAERE